MFAYRVVIMARKGRFKQCAASSGDYLVRQESRERAAGVTRRAVASMASGSATESTL